jgi:antitoxin (DNA-binding transcriptional repressor) of toxin-antitoxin stability system
MATVHMTDLEVSNNFDAVLENIRNGVEVVVEQDHRPVALISSLAPQGRLLSDALAIAEARGSTVTLDEGFMKDVEEGIASRSQPWNPPTWE